MSKNKVLIVLAIIILLGVAGFWWNTKDSEIVATNPTEENEDTVIGCYVSRTDKDVYTLNIREMTGNIFAGSLAFKNFQKDSSSGAYNGTYENDVLLGEYAFQSEGMDSVMEVAFKKEGPDFVRGYGEVNSEGNKFIDPASLEYDPSSSLNLFKKESSCSI